MWNLEKTGTLLLCPRKDSRTIDQGATETDAPWLRKIHPVAGRPVDVASQHIHVSTYSIKESLVMSKISTVGGFARPSE
jgi:hypothetical protein